MWNKELDKILESLWGNLEENHTLMQLVRQRRLTKSACEIHLWEIEKKCKKDKQDFTEEFYRYNRIISDIESRENDNPDDILTKI